jgi:predicted glycoside hydrolase/deacetylase ChbG (UPF0249 family)
MVAVPQLLITADDYGYAHRYDAGILEAAQAGAVDSVSAFATCSAAGPEALVATGVEVGLHLDLDWTHEAPWASKGQREEAAHLIAEQIADFRQQFARPPAYLDGHHHCHARNGLGVVVADLALRHGLPVRSISPRHRRLLRCRGVATADLLVGRVEQSAPALPAELTDEGAAGMAADLVLEWMVHPGYPDRDSGSAYDTGRAEDLELLLGWEPPAGIERRDHSNAALTTEPAAGGVAPRAC